MKKVFNFGKIAYNGKRRENAVTIEIELRRKGGDEILRRDNNGNYLQTGKFTPEYWEFSAVGNIWNRLKTDIVSGGQNLDEIAKYIRSPKFLEIYELWKNWHLNGMHAGTVRQENFVNAFRAGEKGAHADYDIICAALDNAGLLHDNYSGISTAREYMHEPYKYGSAWLVREIPAAVIEQIENL